MPVGNITNILPPELISQINFLTITLQALGGFIIIYIIFQVINTIIIGRRNKKIDAVIEQIAAMNANIAEIKEMMKKKRK